MEMTPAQAFVYIRTYSRWMETESRRETWDESISRYFEFMRKRFGDRVPKKVLDRCERAFRGMETMGSMRALWTAGPALEKNNICGYNCCSLVIKDLRSFAEMFYILMCGVGVGFSVEKQFISQLPTVKSQTGEFLGVHVVEDSREGWLAALMAGLEAWFAGKDVSFDVSKVRKKGERLKTMGGRASGPRPLEVLLEKVKDIVLRAQGRQLLDIECLDICNYIGDAVVVGGVRRSSEISFSDLDSDAMRHAKDLPMPKQRQMSNNSVAYLKKPDAVTFMREWTALAASGTGERGMFNVEAAARACHRRAHDKLGMTWEEFWHFLRTNPCGEILLMALLGQFCNLTEVVVRADDTFATLVDKVKSAIWMGAMQACLTDFPVLRPSFKAACEEERLLGVSLTGQMDNPDLMTDARLADLKEIGIRECRKACKALGIKMSAAIFTGKPSGTVSQLVNCASGAHPRYARFYMRRYRISAVDPLFRMLRDQGLKFVPENGQGPEAVEEHRNELRARGRGEDEIKILVPDWNPDQVYTWVCEFPEKAPDKALTRSDVSAIQQLEWYLKVKKNWCEHNQSMSVYVKDHEWLEVGAWVYKNFDDITGISFFPYDQTAYPLAPYQEISEEVFKAAVATFPKLDYGQLSRYELEDNTTGAQAFACSANGCEMT